LKSEKKIEKNFYKKLETFEKSKRAKKKHKRKKIENFEKEQMLFHEITQKNVRFKMGNAKKKGHNKTDCAKVVTPLSCVPISVSESMENCGCSLESVLKSADHYAKVMMS